MVKTRSSTRHSARADGGDNEGTTNGSEDVILIVDNFSSNSSNSKLTSSTKAKDNNKSATQNKKRKYRPSEKKSEGTNGRGTILAYFKCKHLYFVTRKNVMLVMMKTLEIDQLCKILKRRVQ